jgi:hypothetical protein
MRYFVLILVALVSLGCSDNKSEAPTRGSYLGPEPSTLTCVPNLDGKIDSSEVQAAIDIPISYLVSPAGEDRAVDVAGLVGTDGTFRWDFGTDFATDQIAKITPGTITGKWYEASFPPDAFVTPFDAGGSVENVLVQDDQSLWLLGLASREPSPPEGKTLVVYQAPVELLRFPIQPGTEFVSVGKIENGMIRGLPYAGTDTYETLMDGIGEITLPALVFTQAHRVRTRVTLAPAVGASTSRRQVAWYFECFAEVVRATSKPDEPEADFTVAAEVRKIGL